MESNGGTRSDTTAQMKEGMRELESELQDRLEGLRGYAESADEWIRTFARERPVLAICCAAGLGFLIGRIASRT